VADKEEYDFYQYRKEKPERIYVGKEFPQRFYDLSYPQSERWIKKVINTDEDAGFVNIDGEIVLNVSSKGAIQTRVIIYRYPEGNRRSLTLQRFGETKGGVLNPRQEVSFTFTRKEWYELLKFLDDTEFIDLSDKESFQLDNFREGETPRVRVQDQTVPKELSSRDIIEEIKDLTHEEKIQLLNLAKRNLFSKEELDLLSGRKDGLEEFRQNLLNQPEITEKEWQQFFERETWIFGYGLDYRFFKILQRESSVSDSNVDGKDSVITDFLATDTRFTTLIELKRPDTSLFEDKKNRSRSWRLSNHLTHAVSQILAQKAEWQLKSERKNYDKKTNEEITELTADPNAILIIGSYKQFEGRDFESRTKARTFELYRRNLRNIEIFTFDELYDRAKFIVQSDKSQADTPNKASDLPF
jgi:hypothetical protein